MLTVLRAVTDAHITEFGYPDGSRVEVLQDDLGVIHRIQFPTPSASITAGQFDLAPNGSQIIDPTKDSGALWLKTGIPGQADGDWKHVGITT